MFARASLFTLATCATCLLVVCSKISATYGPSGLPASNAAILTLRQSATGKLRKVMFAVSLTFALSHKCNVASMLYTFTLAREPEREQDSRVKTQRTDAANRATRNKLRSMSASELRQWGLHCFAIYSGQQSAKAYKARGLDSFVHARAKRWPKKIVDNTEDKPRTKQLPIG